MKRLHLEHSWPDSWKYCYPYDQLELWGGRASLGYAYAYAMRRDKTLELLREAVPPGAKVLDVAAAQGNFSLTMAEMGYRVTWNDLRADLAEYVQRKHERGDLDYAPGNVFELGFDADFDCALITEIIEHVAHPDEFLRKVAAMIKPGGYVIMSTPNGAYLRNHLPKFSECPDPSQFEASQFGPNSDDHIFLFWPEEIPTLAEQAGLILEKHKLFTNPLTNGHMKLEAALKVLPRLVVMGMENLSEKLPQPLRHKLMAGSATRFKKPDA